LFYCAVVAISLREKLPKQVNIVGNEEFGVLLKRSCLLFEIVVEIEIS